MATALTLTVGALTVSAVTGPTPSAAPDSATVSIAAAGNQLEDLLPPVALLAAKSLSSVRAPAAAGVTAAQAQAAAAAAAKAKAAAAAAKAKAAAAAKARAAAAAKASRATVRTAAPKAYWTPSLSKTGLAAVRALAPVRFGTPAYSRWYAKILITRNYKWSYSNYQSLNSMWWRESNWQYKVRSRSGKYLGLAQTSASVIRSYGYSVSSYLKNPEVQVQVGLRYIKSRYKTPSRAWSFWRAHHWY